MILLEDTRQQAAKHKLKNMYFSENEIIVRRTKLYIGDYTLPTDQSVCVDTKFSMQEIIGDICGKQHERFRNELLRAVESNIKLYILIENEDGVKSIQDVFKWENPRLHRYNKIADMHNIGKWLSIPLPKGKPTSGAVLGKAMTTMEAKYGVTFCFCNPKDAGRKVVELLTQEK